MTSKALESTQPPEEWERERAAVRFVVQPTMLPRSGGLNPGQASLTFNRLQQTGEQVQ